MASDAVQKQDQHIVEDFVNQEPVRFNMTFPTALIIAGKIVIPVSLFKGFSVCEFFDNGKQFVGILALLLCKFQIFFELNL